MSSAADLAPALARLERRAKARDLWLMSPALLFVLALLALPVGWLAVLSLQSGGVITGEHYMRLVTDPVYLRSILLTLKIAIIVTALAVAIGYPISYLLSQLNSTWATIGLTLVMVPFWTSLLVRTYAWLVLLQRQGLINRTLLNLGIIDEPLYLAHNETGTIIGMLHIMVPLLILPLYANMKRIDNSLIFAAASLGASPTQRFWRVYFPLSLPGLTAGMVLIFVLSLGFYITPAILGGGRTLMIAMLMERNVNLFFEWGAASSLAIVFVALVLGLFFLLNRLVPVERVFENR